MSACAGRKEATYVGYCEVTGGLGPCRGQEAPCNALTAT